MRTQRTKSQRARNIGAAICALLLCFGMVGLLASMGASSAHADGGASDGAATPSATKVETKSVGWYASGTNSKIDGSGEDLIASPGSCGYSGSGGLVSLPGIRLSGGKAYIAADKLDAFLASTGLKIYDSPNTALGSGLSWWELIAETTVEVPDPVAPTKPEPSLPDTEKDTSDRNTEDPTPTPEPEKTPNPTNPSPDRPTNNASQGVNRTDRSSEEAPLLSVRCRQSESEAKIAELESQGYEIVRVEKDLKWFS